jgi:FkbM family methyltransferase
VNDTAEVRLTAPHDLVTYPIAGPAGDRGVIGEIEHSGGTYEPQVMEVLRRLLPPDAVVIDVGANIGVFAVVMARLAPKGRVFAFEPAPENFAYLLRNIAANRAGNVTAEQSAVWDRPGTVPFVYTPESPSGSFVAAGGSEPPGTMAVEAVRLDDYVTGLGLRRIDLVMIDAEGAEMPVLRGASQTLVAHRPALLVEVNPVSLRRFGGTSFRDLVRLLRQDRVLYTIPRSASLTRIVSDDHLEHLLRREGVVDLLALPKRHPAARHGAAAAWARGRGQAALLARAFSGTRPPDNNFVVEPAFSLAPPPEQVQGHPGQNLQLTVTVRNESPYWFSSDFVYHPVHVSYRWLDAQGTVLDVESHRGRFATPLAPGASATVSAPVHLPPVPGTYQLAFTLLQESFAWFDDLDPSLRLTVPGTVIG